MNSSTSSFFHRDYLPLLCYLAQPVTEIVHCISGQRSPDWPKNILQFRLLSAPQLDNLACFFDQVSPPMPYTSWYPRRLEPPWIGDPSQEKIDLCIRRRRFGHFIGLSESDAFACHQYGMDDPEHDRDESDAQSEIQNQKQIEGLRGAASEGPGDFQAPMILGFVECIEREWRAALERR